MLQGHTDWVTSLLLLSDGRIVSGSFDSTLRIWNPSSGLCETVLQGHTREVTSLLLLSDGRIVSEDFSGMSLLWSASSAGLGQVWNTEECFGVEFRGLRSVEVGRIEDKVAEGYRIEDGLGRSVVGIGLGRVFLDEVVDWVVKRGEFVIIFERAGGAHFFQEVRLS